MSNVRRIPALDRSLARRDICPRCGGALDTGWECNSCGYDAMNEAYPPHMRAIDQKYPHED